jgi:recombination protein RecT
MSEALQKQDTQLTNSQKFTSKVLAEFQGNVGEIAVTDFQRRLIQNYFISIDMALKTAETNRLKKQEKNRDQVAVTWQNVNMEALAQTVVHTARLGLDPLLPNHVHFIPFKNNSTSKYDLQVMEGYKGKEIKAVKYGLDVPTEIIFELVYSNDKFKPLKKSFQNKIESYEFDIEDPFDRGEIKGGFAYFMYENPEKNRLVMMSMKDFEKRKPKYAAPEFWGGEKDVWENGKKTGKKEPVEGWLEEMCLKTLKRAAYGSITIDSQKIDDTYQFLKQREMESIETRVENEIEENANSEMIDVEYDVLINQPEEPLEPQQEVKEEKPERGPGF